MLISEVKPGQQLNLVVSLGPRRNMRRSRFAGMSLRKVCTVLSVGESLVTVEVGGERKKVEARQLEATDA